MENDDKHKFVTGGTGYNTTTYCEYCGLIIFHANYPEKYEKNKDEARKPCLRNSKEE